MEMLIKVKPELLLTHQFILGGTDSGKTYAELFQYQNLVNQPNLSTTYFSVEGNETGILEYANNVILLDCSPNGNFRFDPLGVVEGARAIDITDDICRNIASLNIKLRGIGILKPIILEAVEAKMAGKQVSLSNIYDSIKGVKASESKEVLLNRMTLLKDTEFFQTSQPIRMDILAHAHVMFLIEHLDSFSQNFFINSYVSKLMRYKRTIREHINDN